MAPSERVPGDPARSKAGAGTLGHKLPGRVRAPEFGFFGANGGAEVAGSFVISISMGGSENLNRQGAKVAKKSSEISVSPLASLAPWRLFLSRSTPNTPAPAGGGARGVARWTTRRYNDVDAERAAALIELARLRSVPVVELMSELGLEPGGDGR